FNCFITTPIIIIIIIHILYYVIINNNKCFFNILEDVNNNNNNNNNNTYFCLWCQTNSSCSDYPVSYVIPPASVCKLSQARWGVCWGELTFIFDRDDEQFARRREEIRQRADERYVNLTKKYSL
uniref:Uncharacterized protein n=1 Tax=Sinocyclocheilus rhinocerous TaxID=307959 RepID=A0A673N4S0_9TELE